MRTWSLSSIEPLVGLAGEIGRGHHDLEFALQAFADSFGNLHHDNLCFGARGAGGASIRVSKRLERQRCDRRGAGGGT